MSTLPVRALTFDQTRSSIAAMLLKLADRIAPPAAALSKPVAAPAAEARNLKLAPPTDTLPPQLRLSLGWRAVYYR